MVAEIERCAALGAHRDAFSENPSKLGLPSIHDAEYYWDPVFDAAAQAKLPLCQHMGSSSALPQTSADAAYIVTFSLGPTSAMFCLNDWLFSGQFVRHPDLSLSERGWHRLDSLHPPTGDVGARSQPRGVEGDVELDSSAAWVDDQAKGAKTESFDVPLEQIFRDHVYGCFIDDVQGVRNLDAIGYDNVMIETDYPHVDSTFPVSWDMAREGLAGLSDENVYKIVQGNARKVFSTFDFAEEPALAPG